MAYPGVLHFVHRLITGEGYQAQTMRYKFIKQNWWIGLNLHPVNCWWWQRQNIPPDYVEGGKEAEKAQLYIYINANRIRKATQVMITDMIQLNSLYK